MLAGFEHCFLMLGLELDFGLGLGCCVGMACMSYQDTWYTNIFKCRAPFFFNHRETFIKEKRTALFVEQESISCNIDHMPGINYRSNHGKTPYALSITREPLLSAGGANSLIMLYWVRYRGESRIPNPNNISTDRLPLRIIIVFFWFGIRVQNLRFFFGLG